MVGSKIGGMRASKTNKERHGEDFYKRIGRLGGIKGRGKDYKGGFAADEVGADGLTGRQRAVIAGRKGGLISKRPSKKEVTEDE